VDTPAAFATSWIVVSARLLVVAGGFTDRSANVQTVRFPDVESLEYWQTQSRAPSTVPRQRLETGIVGTDPLGVLDEERAGFLGQHGDCEIASNNDPARK